MPTTPRQMNVTFKFEIIDQMLQFRIYVPDYHDYPDLPDPLNYLPVPEEDVDFLISLESGMLWEFDFGPNGNADVALYFKNSDHAHYYKRKRVARPDGKNDPSKLLLRAKWSGHARAQHDSKVDVHPFKVAILLEQPGGGKLRVLVDPDVKNPPPIGQLVEPGSVPFSVEPA